MTMSSTTSPTPTVTGLPSRTSNEPSPTCTTGVPDRYGYVPPEACNANYAYYPSFEGNLAFAVLFGLTTTVHLAQAIAYKKVRPMRFLCHTSQKSGV
jgi:hypothetical protein